ncbi:hypothetical protein [Bacillus sp. FJAT-45350]|uniref:hypothetical protein n=1 Tax=Bacillus sp. FJAT-45350 TaxID=2011014 RepID=UPI000BB7E8B6|nr:hypothetical protein [Bacillus sp. FJAT-45350]
MALEWFDRVCAELQDYLESICEEYDELAHMTINRAAKHPSIDFFVENEEDEREYFNTLFFDPNNEEFYVEEFDTLGEQTTRIILNDFEDIVEDVHEAFHEFMGDEDALVYEDGELVDELDEEEYLEEDDYDDDEDDDEEIYEEIVDVDWTSPEVLAYSYMEEVEVAYQFGIVQDTGDGVLRRVNRIMTEEDEMIEDETNFIFSKEEAGTIMELIENNIDLMDGFDERQ